MIVKGLFALALGAVATVATAAPITYSFTGRLSGSLAGSVFTLADVDLSLTSDTDTVFRPTPAVRPTLFNSAPGTLRFTIGGVDGTFDELFNAFSVTIFNNSSLVGFTQLNDNDLIDVVDPALAGYDLRSPVNSITNSPLDFLNFDTPLQTSRGTLVFFDDDDASAAFSATLGAVPEPATWATTITGFAIVGGALRRRRPRRAACM